jgi:energy-coupling factor transport system permease protein
MPVLEGALEHSVDLAAAMDSRGYGRTFDATRTSRRITTGLMFGGLLGVCVGVYGLLDGTTSSWFGLPMLCAGSALAAAGIVLGGRRSGRSRYRSDPWALPEWLVVACGVVPAVAMFINVDVAPEQLYLASVVMTPPVPALACLGILVAALPAVLAPPQPLSVAESRSAERALEVVG